MNTVRVKVRALSIAAVVAALCVATVPVYAEDATQKPAASKQENIGALTGVAIGAAAGGPIGAIVGLVAGAWAGDHYHKQVVAHKETVADLNKSESERTRLTQSVTELNASLAQQQERGEKLDLALGQTNEVETDVSFRTNDASIESQAVSPLLKLGALAAALPDAKVRVAGYADPRGSDAYNTALSKRRAEAVAAVLAMSGVDKDRLIIEAHGADAECGDDDPDGYALERRVTVRIERPTADTVARNE